MPTESHNKQFFFINKSKTSKHLSQSLASEKAAIQRHVQTGRKRSRKSAAQSTRRRSRSASSTPEVVDRQTTSPRQPSPDGHEPVQHTSAELSKTDNIDDDPVLDHRDLVETVQWHLTSPAFQDILGKRDPFDVASVPLDVRVAGLIHYYMYYYHPSQWPNEMALLQKGVYTFQDAVHDIMQTAINDKLAMYCLLAASASRLQFVDRLPCPPVVGAENHYMRKALELMNSYIPVADLQDSNQLRQLLYSIGFLGSAEAYRGNIAACKAHFDAQVRLVELSGGLSGIADEHLRGHLAMADLFLACVNLEPCKFDPWYDPGPASSLYLLEHELNRICTSSTATALLAKSDDVVPPNLREPILNLVESHWVKSQITTSSMAPERALEVTHWITMRNMAIRNSLLALSLGDSRAHCLRISVIMWSLLAMNVTGRAKTVKMMADKLYSSLMDTASPYWAQYEDVKLWIVLVGLYCADEDGDASAGFMEEFIRLRHWARLSLSPTTYAEELVDSLEAFQRGFFFDVTAQRSRTHRLVERMQFATNQLPTRARVTNL